MSAGFVLTHRDFQARNLMMRPGDELGLLDFDDALLGSPAYDLASLLLDAHCPADWDFVDAMVGEFAVARAAAGAATGTRAEFQRLFVIQGLQRSLKAAGRFIWIAEELGKKEYLDDVEICLAHARRMLDRYDDLAGLQACLARYDARLGAEARVSPSIPRGESD